jgi:hypothetical protein
MTISLLQLEQSSRADDIDVEPEEDLVDRIGRS